MSRRFSQVDVFGSGAWSGNPVAVVLDAEGMTGEEMQRFARWTNLSETTCVLPPGWVGDLVEDGSLVATPANVAVAGSR